MSGPIFPDASAMALILFDGMRGGLDDAIASGRRDPEPLRAPGPGSLGCSPSRPYSIPFYGLEPAPALEPSWQNAASSRQVAPTQVWPRSRMPSGWM